MALGSRSFLLSLMVVGSVGCAKKAPAPEPAVNGAQPSSAEPVASLQQPLPVANAANASDSASTLLALGAELPDVSATSQSGEVVRLRALEGKPLVVYFYPKDDTPGCTIEAQEIRDVWQELQSIPAVVVGVSVDDAPSHKAFADKYALPFVLLPDPDHKLVAAFGVPLRNGRAKRVSFVFSRDGHLRKVFPDVNPRGHGKELLDALRGLGA